MPRLFSRIDWWFIVAALVLMPIALVLALLHPLFTLLSLPGAISLGAIASQFVSRVLFHKSLNPPRSCESLATGQSRTWSDWVLFIGMIVLAGYVLMFFGEAADCLRHEDFWRTGWTLC